MVEQAIVLGVLYLIVLLGVVRENFTFGFNNGILIGVVNFLISIIVFTFAMVVFSFIDWGIFAATSKLKKIKKWSL